MARERARTSVRTGEGAGGQLRRLEAACAARGVEVPPAMRAMLVAKDKQQSNKKQSDKSEKDDAALKEQ